MNLSELIHESPGTWQLTERAGRILPWSTWQDPTSRRMVFDEQFFSPSSPMSIVQGNEIAGR
jgi:hypothetical protein